MGVSSAQATSCRKIERAVFSAQQNVDKSAELGQAPCGLQCSRAVSGDCRRWHSTLSAHCSSPLAGILRDICVMAVVSKMDRAPQLRWPSVISGATPVSHQIRSKRHVAARTGERFVIFVIKFVIFIVVEVRMKRIARCKKEIAESQRNGIAA